MAVSFELNRLSTLRVNETKRYAWKRSDSTQVKDQKQTRIRERRSYPGPGTNHSPTRITSGLRWLQWRPAVRCRTLSIFPLLQSAKKKLSADRGKQSNFYCHQEETANMVFNCLMFVASFWLSQCFMCFLFSCDICCVILPRKRNVCHQSAQTLAYRPSCLGANHS